jgi:hypothetical protein
MVSHPGTPPSECPVNLVFERSGMLVPRCPFGPIRNITAETRLFKVSREHGQIGEHRGLNEKINYLRAIELFEALC